MQIYDGHWEFGYWKKAMHKFSALKEEIVENDQ
jgi:hypothetical protein